MRTLPLLLAAALVLSAPVITVAQSQPARAGDFRVGRGKLGAAVTLDFTSGSLGTLFGRIMTVAKGFLLLALFVGLFLEAFKAPGAPREYGVVVWRLVIVLFLLAFYHRIFGTVINAADYIATKLAPTEVAVVAYFDARAAAEKAALNTGLVSKKAADVAKTERDWADNLVERVESAVITQYVGPLQDVILTLFFAVTGSVRFLVEGLGRILTSLFYLLGPLALVFSIPRVSGSGGSWFRYFVTVASWPIFTGVLMSILVHMGVQSSADSLASHGAAIASALVFTFAMFAAPVLATIIVSGSLANVAAAGGANAQQVLHGARTVGSLVAGAASGGVGAAAGAATNAAGKAAGSAASKVIANPPG